MTNALNQTPRASLWTFITFVLSEGWTLEFHKPGMAPIRIGVARFEQHPTVTACAAKQGSHERDGDDE
jgi:hypothetical protein